MPLYDFTCKQCGKEIERLLPMAAEVPQCCGEAMQRGCGYISMVRWNFRQKNAIPMTHNSEAMAKAATKGHQMVMA